MPGGTSNSRPLLSFSLLLSLLLAAAPLSSSLSSFSHLQPLRFDQAYTQLFGDGNLRRSDDDRTVRLLLDERTGSGFISSSLYSQGFFSAKIKLPSNYTAGVVVAFYTSNGDIFRRNHDELDFEFLGGARHNNWKLQTNIYGNGSTHRGREERYTLPFDPTREAHRYSILWSPKTIIFYVDDIPIREVKRSEEMGGEYPLKPMALYATIWDGSSWATNGGQFKVNYRYSPFVSEFSDLVLSGCQMDPIEMVGKDDSSCAVDDMGIISPNSRRDMAKFRERNLIYSACYDNYRYPIPFPDCEFVEAEKERLDDSGHFKIGRRHRHRVDNRRTDS